MGIGITSHPQTERRTNQAGLGIPAPQEKEQGGLPGGTAARSCLPRAFRPDLLRTSEPWGLGDFGSNFQVSSPGLREAKRLLQDLTTGQRRSGARAGSRPRVRTEGGRGGHRTKDTAGQLSAPFVGQEGRGARSRTCPLGHPLLGPPRRSPFNQGVFLQLPLVTPRGGSSDRLSSYQILPSQQVPSHLWPEEIKLLKVCHSQRVNWKP